MIWGFFVVLCLVFPFGLFSSFRSVSFLLHILLFGWSICENLHGKWICPQFNKCIQEQQSRGKAGFQHTITWLFYSYPFEFVFNKMSTIKKKVNPSIYHRGLSFSLSHIFSWAWGNLLDSVRIKEESSYMNNGGQRWEGTDWGKRIEEVLVFPGNQASV